MKQYLAIIVMSLMAWSGAMAEDFDHSVWDGLVKTHVLPINNGTSTGVDYGAFSKNRKQLQAYLATLAKPTRAEFDGWSEDEQLAFLINAYNAWTVELILTKWPDLESIKDLGSIFQSPWKKDLIPLFGDTISLDDLEHGLIRGMGRYNEPRIHFAVNCASIGCPALRAEAFSGAALDRQLEEQTKSFLEDRSRNRVQHGELYLSSIFKWYREDFERGWKGYNRLEDFILNYAESLQLSKNNHKALKDRSMDINFLKYDWDLNVVE